MRAAILAIPLILLAGCKSAPPIEKVSADTKTELQRQMNQDYADKHATVQTVSLVKTTAPKYEGVATIAAYNSTFTIPLMVTSDGNTTLVTADGQKLNAEFQLALQNELAPLAGKYSDYILNSGMFDLMPASLKAAKADFVARLKVIVPIDSSGRYYFGTGCAPHACTMDEAAWAIDKTTGKGTAVIVKYVPDAPGIPAHENFQLFGATTANLPPPLAAWAHQEGMTEMNAAEDVPAYQAPQK